MSKTKAGERKRTVTVTTGDVTVGLVAKVGKNMDGVRGNTPVSMTTLAGVGLDMAVREWCEVWGVPIPADWSGHGS